MAARKAKLVSGTDQADTLVGGPGDDLIEGGLGGDRLFGSSGNDVLHADAADKLNGGLYQGENLDFAHNELSGGAGRDRLYGADGNDILRGDAGNDFIQDAHGSDRLEGGSGDDVMLAWLDGRDRFDGGSGYDRAGGWVDSSVTQDQSFAIQGTHATLRTGGAVTATFRDVESYFISSGAGDDTLIGTGARQVDFSGFDGDDTLVGTTGHDRLSGGLGDDTMSGGAGNDVIDDQGGFTDADGGSGNDTVQLSEARGEVVAGSGHDRVTIDALRWLPADPAVDLVVNLGRGDDALVLRLPGAASGTAQLRGGSGRDVAGIVVARTDDAVVDLADGYASATLRLSLTGFEQLHATTGSGDDTLTGGALDDVLDAGTGRDTLAGRSGNDTLTMTHGSRADGGAGRDTLTLDLSGHAAGVSFTFTSGAAVAVDGTTSFTGIESLRFIGGSGNDRVTGGAGRERLADGAGDDALSGAGGNDVFTRGAIDSSATWDEVQANLQNPADPGTDVFDGGAGYDTLRFAGRNVPIDFMLWIPVVDRSIVLDLDDPSLNGGLAEGLTALNFERFEGGAAADTLRGSAGREHFFGGEHNDLIDGRGGDDRVDGGAGADDLAGGAGRDQFWYRPGWDSAWRYGFGNPEDTSGDRIRDFTRGEDVLVFDLKAPAGTTVRSGADLAWSGRRAQFAFDTDAHELWYDADGVGTKSQAVRVATLDNVDALDSSDFMFV